jgi:cysteinyl-tRNA synthetase
VELFQPLQENVVTMYVCGPTVYNYIHIGNARPVIFFDTVCRFFEAVGYEVKMVSNFTDIDDKIINEAIKEKITEQEVAEKYIKAYFDSYYKLGCLTAYANPRVTQNIEAIIAFISQLIEKGYAYESDGDVFFRVRKIKEYGILSNQTIDDLESGSRVDVNAKKEDPNDFALWKTTTVGQKWASPFGNGRPGWHTECVVMINNILGPKIDIHGGGNDLKFPHHENEIAQSIAINGNYLANYWLHNARVDLAGEKMSKSLGNVLWLKDILEVYDPKVFRLFILSNHYRQTINYSEELMQQIVNEYDKIEHAYVSLYRKLELAEKQRVNEYTPEKDDFDMEMADDFNTANAISVIDNLIKAINKQLRMKDDFVLLGKYLTTFEYMLDILGIRPDVKPLTATERSIIDSWQQARMNKDFAQADFLRNQINEMGIKL